jgi:tetratricopeptide (TPR) repeat protein
MSGGTATIFFSLLLVLLLASPAYSQQPGAAAPQRAEVIFKEWMERMPTADPADNLRQLDSLYAYLQAQKDTCRMAHALSWRSFIHDNTGKLDSAMQCINDARAMMRGCDSLIYMSIQVNYSGILLTLGEIDKSIAVSSAAIQAWNHSWPYSRSLDGLYTNLAIGYAMNGDLEKAIVTFRE